MTRIRNQLKVTNKRLDHFMEKVHKRALDDAKLERRVRLKKEMEKQVDDTINVDFNSVDVENHVENQVNIIRDAVSKGAIGLKVYKSLGLTNKDSKGERVRVNDERLAPIWDVCGELNIPVLIHSADPFQFWLPKDNQNERWFQSILLDTTSYKNGILYLNRKFLQSFLCPLVRTGFFETKKEK